MSREAIKVLILLSLELLREWVERNMRTEANESKPSGSKKKPSKKKTN